MTDLHRPTLQIKQRRDQTITDSYIHQGILRDMNRFCVSFSWTVVGSLTEMPEIGIEDVLLRVDDPTGLVPPRKLTIADDLLCSRQHLADGCLGHCLPS